MRKFRPAPSGITLVEPLTYQASLPINLTYAFDVPVPRGTRRVRAVIINRDQASGAGAAGATTIDLAYYTTNGSGAAAGTPVKRLGRSIPAGAVPYVDPWVELSAFGGRGSDGKIVFAHTVPAGTEMWTENNTTHAKRADSQLSVDPLPTLSTTDSCSFFLRLEFDGFDPRAIQRAVAWGNSLTRGYGSAGTAKMEGSWLYRLGRDRGWAVDNAGISGGTLGQWVDAARPQYRDTLQMKDAVVFIELGGNDLPSQTLGNFQTDLTTAVNKIRVAGAAQIWVFTITPFLSYLANNAVRVQCNDHIKTRPDGITGVIDADAILGIGSALNPLYDNGDGDHWNDAGHGLIGDDVYTQVGNPR